MLFAIDIGNSNTVLGLFDGRNIVHSWRIRTERECTEDELGVVISGLFAGAGAKFSDVSKTVISSVVPPLERSYDAFCKTRLGMPPLWVSAGRCGNITIRYSNPNEIGADRIVNAAAAHEKYKCDLIIVDFGTATTFDLVSAEGAYQGGVIAPGIGISAEALFSRTSKLPMVDLLTVPESVVGRDTAGSIKSGIIFGYAGLVDEIVRRIMEETDKPARVIATGGLAPLIASVSSSIESVEPDLTLEGLRIIAETES